MFSFSFRSEVAGRWHAQVRAGFMVNFLACAGSYALLANATSIEMVPAPPRPRAAAPAAAATRGSAYELELV